jgi:hypothetical protein
MYERKEELDARFKLARSGVQNKPLYRKIEENYILNVSFPEA